LITLLCATGIALAFLACSDGGGDNQGSAPATGTDEGAGRALPAITFTGSQGRTATLAVEVADDAGEMQCGLMHRTSLPEGQGMVFIYAQDANGGFWMRNTLIPLSIAYAAADGRIVDILEMKPVPSPRMTPWRLADGREVAIADGEPVPAGATWVTYPPRAEYRYVIEANQGWFARHGIAAGDRVDVSRAVEQRDAAAPPPLCLESGA
jgi:uncharacterized membrane protein (UPF0127 family)